MFDRFRSAAGGALFADASTTLIDTNFTGNWQRNSRASSVVAATAGGAAVYCKSAALSTPIVRATNCRFDRNEAQAGSGGAVLLQQCDGAFTDSQLCWNTATVTGGALFSVQATGSFTRTTFCDNSAPV